ncbi:MAG: hypothetical protein ABI703_10070 [Gemmatimonadales bacterium]
MDHADVVSLLAATICAGLPEKAKPTHQSDYDRLAVQAWDLYNAVQLASTEAAKRLAARR